MIIESKDQDKDSAKRLESTFENGRIKGAFESDVPAELLVICIKDFIMMTKIIKSCHSLCRTVYHMDKITSPERLSLTIYFTDFIINVFPTPLLKTCHSDKNNNILSVITHRETKQDRTGKEIMLNWKKARCVVY